MKRETDQVPPRIAYVIKCFPRLSETFILHEVLELERQGLSLRIFSLLQPTGKINQAVQDVQARITYIPRGFPVGAIHLLAAAGKRLLTSPRRFLCTVITSLVRYHHPATPRHLFLAAYLANRLEREGITHIHAHYANTPTTIAEMAHSFTGIPYSFTAHAKDIYLSRTASLVYKMRHARFVVTCTAYNQCYLTTLLDPSATVPIHCIHHGLNLRAFPTHPILQHDRDTTPLLLTVARLVEKKGLPYLLQACRLLKDQGYAFTCRIVGEGPQRPLLEQQISELDLSDRVELWGAETHERVIEMYREATMQVLPCIIGEDGDRDGIPNVLVEAMHMGVPVISTPVSGIPELITHGENGLLVPQRDGPALAGAMKLLLNDAELGQRLARNARQTTQAHFDMARNTTYLLGLLLRQGEDFFTSHESRPARNIEAVHSFSEGMQSATSK
jgi:glycosyltransferase involved in cell wall biosynthesis